MRCFKNIPVFGFLSLLCWLCSASLGADAAKNPARRYSTQAQSLYVPQVLGYSYPGPSRTHSNRPIVLRHETIVASGSSPVGNTAMPAMSSSKLSTETTHSNPTATTTITAGPTTKQQVMTTFKVKATTELFSTTTEGIIGESATSSSAEESLNSLEASDAVQEEARLLLKDQMIQIETIDVACGKQRMTVRITFDEHFDGIIYAKGHYNDPNCRFIGQNSGQKVYQFDMVVGQCGVSFIDAGLTSGGMAYVEGTLVAILEPGVQEAWDTARRIRCLWEGNIDQTVTFPLAINVLDSQTLTFSGDTASASLEIQSGRGPRASPVQGLVRIGELLTAVVTVQGDSEFDLVVRNCVATDGTPENRITLSDNLGCTTKPKLMGGWKKQKGLGNVAAYAYLTAFKFPDVMDLFLECTVSLCKGACEECPDAIELNVEGPDSEENSQQNDVGAKKMMSVNGGRKKRNLEKESSNTNSFNNGSSAESLRLRRVVHVVGPDDLPEVAIGGLRPTIYGGHCSDDCVSLFGVMCIAGATLLVMFTALAVFGVVKRNQRIEKW